MTLGGAADEFGRPDVPERLVSPLVPRGVEVPRLRGVPRTPGAFRALPAFARLVPYLWPTGRPRVTRAGVLARSNGRTETAKRPCGQIAHVEREGRSDIASTPSDARASNGDAGAFPVASGSRSAAKFAGSVHTGALTQRGGPGDRHNSTAERFRTLADHGEPLAGERGRSEVLIRCGSVWRDAVKALHTLHSGLCAVRTIHLDNGGRL